MDTRLLRTFDAVVQHGSFTAAAHELGYTQSAVSQQVAALESSLGIALFERRPFGVTAAGSRLAEHAASILLRLDVATSEVTAVDRRATTTLVATALSAATPQVARLLAHAQHREGSASSTLLVASAHDVVARVARGQCSAGVVDGIVGRSDPLGLADPGLLTSLLLSVGSLAVVMPDDHPFVGRRGIAWSAVADAQWIETPQLVPHLGPGAAQLLQRRHGRVRYDGADHSTLANLVAAGHGLALMPTSWSHGTSTVRSVPLTEPALVHRIEVVVLRQRADEWSQLVERVR